MKTTKVQDDAQNLTDSIIKLENEIEQTDVEIEATTKELVDKKTKLKKISTSLRKKLKKLLGELYIKNIDALIDITPQHDRTSCNDTNPNNEGRCTKCTLMCMKRKGEWDPHYSLCILISKELK